MIELMKLPFKKALWHHMFRKKLCNSITENTIRPMWIKSTN